MLDREVLGTYRSSNSGCRRLRYGQVIMNTQTIVTVVVNPPLFGGTDSGNHKVVKDVPSKGGQMTVSQPSLYSNWHLGGTCEAGKD